MKREAEERVAKVARRRDYSASFVLDIVFRLIVVTNMWKYVCQEEDEENMYKKFPRRNWK